MLLALRSLWEKITGQQEVERGQFGYKRRKLPLRKGPRRVAEWSEAVAPAFTPEYWVSVVGVAANPQIGFANVAIGVPVLGVAALRPLTSDFRLNIGQSVAGVAARPRIGNADIIAEIGLFDYELAALMMA